MRIGASIVDRNDLGSNTVVAPAGENLHRRVVVKNADGHVANPDNHVGTPHGMILSVSYRH
jgi:hypothetical protein